MADAGTLLSAASATGGYKPRTKGVYTFAVNGDFTGGGSAALQMLGPDAANPITIDDTSFSAAGAVNVELPAGRYRALVTGTVVALTVTLKEAGWQGR